MQSYRKRVAVQMQHEAPKTKRELSRPPNKRLYPDVKAYLLKAINIYERASKRFEPLSDEWKICMEELQKYKTDFELLEHGTYDERKGVIEKYGRGSH